MKVLDFDSTLFYDGVLFLYSMFIDNDASFMIKLLVEEIGDLYFIDLVLKVQ